MKNILAEAIHAADTDPIATRGPWVRAPGVTGQTTGKVQTLLSILAAHLPSNEAYLEVGIFQGATLIGALLDNLRVKAYACDKFIGGAGASGDDCRRIFKENVARFENRLPKFTLYDADCFELAQREKPFDLPIGVYFYDGFHSTESTQRGLVEFKRFFAKEVIIVIDDWNWECVRTGGLAGIHELKPRAISDHSIRTEKVNSTLFFNGLGLFWLDFG
jgi:hypothetical protein